MLRYTPEDEQLKKESNYILISNLTSYLDTQALTGIFIDDVEYLESPATGRAVYHEIIAPDMILILRPEPYTGAIIKP